MFTKAAVVLFVTIYVGLAADTPAPAPPVVYNSTCKDALVSTYDNCLQKASYKAGNNCTYCRRCLELFDDCDESMCTYRQLGWLDGFRVSQKMSDDFDQFAREHPAWAAAVGATKQACFGPRGPIWDFPYHSSCLPKEVYYCSMSMHVKNAPGSRWIINEECRGYRSVLDSCYKSATDQ